MSASRIGCLVAACVVLLSAVAVTAKEPLTGILGASTKGVARITKEKRTPRSAMVEMLRGRLKQRAHAHRRLTFAPVVARTETHCIVKLNAKFESLSTRGPGGLGEVVWGIDLQDADGGWLRKVEFVTVDGEAVTAKGMGGDKYGIELAKDKATPLDVQITWKWFNLQETEIFSINAAIYKDSKIKPADAGKAPEPAKPQPLDKGRGQGLRGTYLTWKELTDAPQSLPGYWNKSGQDVLVRFAVSDNGRNMVIRTADEKGWWGQLQNYGNEWRGRMWTSPVSGPFKHVKHLQPGAMKASSDNTRFTGEWSGRMTSNETGKLTDEPHSGRIEYTRVVGTTFGEIKPGRYIYLLGVVAPAAYKGMVRLTWDFSKVGAKRVRVVHGESMPDKYNIHSPKFDITKLTPEDMKKLTDPKFQEELKRRRKRTGKTYKGPTGMFDFVTERPGTFEFNVQVLDDKGKIIHADFAKAVIPPLN